MALPAVAETAYRVTKRPAPAGRLAFDDRIDAGPCRRDGPPVRRFAGSPVRRSAWSGRPPVHRFIPSAGPPVRRQRERVRRSGHRRTVVAMELPETMQPSSDERIAGWIGVMVALSAGAVWINRRRRAAGANRH
jgi:hypothetical protein